MCPRRRSRAPRALVTAVVAVLSLLMARPASAAPPDPPPPAPAPPVTEPVGPPVPYVPSPPPGMPGQLLLPPSPAPAIAPELTALELFGPDFSLAAERLADSQQAQERAATARREAEVRLLVQTGEESDLTDVIALATDRRRRFETRLDAVEEAVEELAVENYMNSGSESTDLVLVELDADEANDAQGQQVLVSAVNDDLISELRDTRKSLNTARTEVTVNSEARRTVRHEIDVTEVAIKTSVADQVRLSAMVLVRTSEVNAARPLSVVRGLGLPLVVLDAYWKAAQRMAVDVPQCGISWWGLAGIGLIESGHGTFGGAEVRANGELTKPIIGIQLNGSNKTAFITDTDGGYYDGDTGFDRAVGPMQFIPLTWEPWKRDGNGDGRFDPQNLYDSAYSAAAYTCAGGPMRSDDDLRRGYFSYNHDLAYAELVLIQAKQYANGINLP